MSTTGTTPTPDLDAIRGRRKRAREAAEHPAVQFAGPAPLVTAALAAVISSADVPVLLGEVVAQRKRADAAVAERDQLADRVRHHERFAEQMKAAAGAGMLLPPRAVRACVAELSAALTGESGDQ